MAGVDLGIAGLSDAEPVGAGGNAVVYRAREVDRDRWVAVKVLRGLVDEAALRRFDRECRAMGRLSEHDGIVTIYYSGFTDRSEPYLVMPFLPSSLQDQLDQSGPMRWREAAGLMAVVARTVEAAHAQDVIHRDLKPDNIMLSAGGVPLVADFGISRLTGGSMAAQSTALTFTPSYSPPEVLKDAAPSKAADIYGLGATLYALVAGAPPFVTESDTNMFALMHRIATEPATDLRPRGVPDELCAVIEQAMSKDPEHRQRNAADLATALETTLTTASEELPQARATPDEPQDEDGDLAGLDESTIVLDKQADSEPAQTAPDETSEFARLRTVDTGPGNLSAQATSFVGRDVEVNELAEVVSQHRLVTLTGVGGVGKTRLAVQVAAELMPEFGDGVWLVELAPVGDPGAVPDAVATALGVTAQAGRSVTAGIAEALAGRRLLVVLDNCEHVVDAAADLIEAILAGSPTVSIITTSREGLRVDGEYLWPVPSLDVAEGARSAAVELFTERARAVVPGFGLDDDADVEAVIEICRRLDGIALAIELAAARMVSMTPGEVLARLNDRFRLLSGSRRGLERHQTLRQAVQWSYDLLTGDEQTVLGTCAVFAAGFDATAVTAVCERFGEYTMLDLLDSLVRKSLVTVNRAGGRTRHGLLETIRQFAEDQGATSGSGTAVAAGEIFDIGEVRDRHARYFATQAVEHWEIWEGPRHGDAADWVEVEFENLRAGFRWAIDRHDLPTATAIAAHTTALGFGLQQFEPVGWAEELLPAAAAAELPQLPRLYTAASSCAYTGRPEDAVRYAQAATVLQTDARYQPFDIGWAGFMEANAHLYAGRSDRHLEICTALAAQTGLAHVVGLCELTFGLPAVGRSDEAIEIADDAINAARAHANPYWIAFALWGYGRAFAETDPARSLDTFRVGLAYTQEHRVPYFEAVIASELAGLEAVHGDLDQALNLFTSSLDSFHQAGNTASLALTFARLAVLFDRTNQPEVAATIYGATTHHPTVDQVVGFTAAVAHLHPNLDAQTLDDCVRTGAAMNLTEAVHYAHHHINTTRQLQP